MLLLFVGNTNSRRPVLTYWTFNILYISFHYLKGIHPSHSLVAEKTSSQEAIKTYDKDRKSVFSLRVRCESKQTMMSQRAFGNVGRKKWIKAGNAYSAFQLSPNSLSLCCCLDG